MFKLETIIGDSGIPMAMLARIMPDGQKASLLIGPMGKDRGAEGRALWDARKSLRHFTDSTWKPRQ